MSRWFPALLVLTSTVVLADSAKKGAFAVRASFIGQGVPFVTRAPSVPITPGVSTVGASWWLGDHATFLVDVGVGAAITGGETQLGFAALFGLDWHFRTSAESMRPLVNFQVGINRGFTLNDELPGLTAQLTGGAEYFLSPEFSLSARLGVGFALRFNVAGLTPGGGIYVLSAFTPGIGAAWYL